MNQPSGKLALQIIPALIAGGVAVWLASSIDNAAVMIVLQFAALCCVAAIAWRAGETDVENIAQAVEPIAPRQVASLVADRRKPVFDRDTGLCVNWYFRLRVEEEMARAARYGQPFTILRVTSPTTEGLDGARLSLKRWLRTVDYAGDLGDELAVMLPATDRSGATIVAERLATTVPNVEFRLAQYPVDGATIAQLLGEDEWHVSDAAALSA